MINTHVPSFTRYCYPYYFGHCAPGPSRNIRRAPGEAARGGQSAPLFLHEVSARDRDTPPQPERSRLSRLVRHTRLQARASRYIPDTSPP